MRLIGRLTPLEKILASRREEMFALFARHYEGVTTRQFEEDLSEKQWVIEVVDPGDGSLRGFSTQCVLHVPWAGGTVRALFSGDTIVDPEFWGDSALSHVWGHLALSLIETYPCDQLYWYLISKGYRTYRFLPVFFHEFYPRYNGTTPPAETEVLHAIGRWKFGDAYDAAQGIIRPREACRLCDGLGAITAARMRDPHVRFFFERNPGHAIGHELCCLAPLSRANFTPAAWRVIDAGQGPVTSKQLSVTSEWLQSVR